MTPEIIATPDYEIDWADLGGTMTDETNGKLLHVNCPGCGKDITLSQVLKFTSEILTVRYTMQPGRKMIVQDFCASLSAMAKSLKLIAREMGAKVEVTLESVSVVDNEVSASVQVLEVANEGKSK